MILEIENVENENYTGAINQINYIVALLKKSNTYLNQKKENPTSPPELETAIEEQIGYVWKLVDLKEHSQFQNDAQLLQLSFNSYDNAARKEYVDEGQWINLKDGKIYKTKNFRPYKAAKYIKTDNTNFKLIHVPEMFIYPGDMNPRVRWKNTGEFKTVNEDILQRILAYSSDNYADTFKAVKNFIKNPLNDKNPVALLLVNKTFINEDKLVIEDSKGSKLTMSDITIQQMPTTTRLSNFMLANPM